MTESNIPPVNYIDFDLMARMCHPIAVQLFDGKSEPMTSFDDHDRALLESALGNPRQTFGSQELYPTLSSKAAVLYYSLIKNHAFKNGNKRTATATFLVFLMINSLVITGEKTSVENFLFDLVIRVADSKGSENRNEFLDEINNWVVGNTEHFDTFISKIKEMTKQQ